MCRAEMECADFSQTSHTFLLVNTFALFALAIFLLCSLTSYKEGCLKLTLQTFFLFFFFLVRWDDGPTEIISRFSDSVFK